jgi:hypothetical protein
LLAQQQAGGEPAADVPQQSGVLPEVVFLGEGPATFEIDPNYHFIVKRNSPFTLSFVPGPIYEARNRERVWSTTFIPEGGVQLYEQEASFGTVEAGCLVEYGQIDDDIDNRINRFFLNGNVIHEVAQGMVTYGSFVVPETGLLTFFAEDSVGMALLLCGASLTPTPTSAPPTSTATSTPVETATSTATPSPTVAASQTASPSPTSGPSATPTQTPEGGPFDTPTPTATIPAASSTPTASATATTLPTATPTATSPASGGQGTVTPTPTKEPRLNTCLRVNFEVGGDVARRGLYVVREVGGRELASWYALEGWVDSGWIYDIDISYPSVYVQVFFYRGDGSDPIEMQIVNPAPGTTYGWLSRGKCHALEVAWPEG